jgi:pSer/pThr/pTyr-binding forkhead associated (FHA) protein
VRTELIGSAGVVLGQGYTLDAPVVTIGRRRENTIVIKHPTVSRHHAKIRRRGDEFVIVDTGSTSGVVVNGQLISGEQLLHDGDRIAIGMDAVFLVQLEPTDDETADDTRSMSESAIITLPIKPAFLADLRIQIDNARREQQVDEIVESEYFQQLRTNAERLRSHPTEHPPKEGDPR